MPGLMNLDNKTQANNSNLGTVVSFTGAAQHFPVHKLTLTVFKHFWRTPPLHKPPSMHRQIRVGLHQAYRNAEHVY